MAELGKTYPKCNKSQHFLLIIYRPFVILLSFVVLLYSVVSTVVFSKNTCIMFITYLATYHVRHGPKTPKHYLSLSTVWRSLNNNNLSLAQSYCTHLFSILVIRCTCWSFIFLIIYSTYLPTQNFHVYVKICTIAKT